MLNGHKFQNTIGGYIGISFEVIFLIMASFSLNACFTIQFGDAASIRRITVILVLLI